MGTAIRVLFALVGLFLLGAAPSSGLPATPTRRVTDDAGVMTTAERDELEARLAAYEREGGRQVVVWIGRNGGGRTIEELAVDAFVAWKVGRAELDDGVALFILVEDRKVRIEVGYGLEDRLTDLVAAQIVRDIVVPRLAAGDFDGAVRTGVEAIVAAVEGRPDALGTATDRERGPPGPEPLGWATWLAIGIAGAAFVVLLFTRPQLALVLLWTILGRGGNRRGGGRGTFLGGGGRSGGGGATGGW